jgi:hypothetical protein
MCSGPGYGRREVEGARARAPRRAGDARRAPRGLTPWNRTRTPGTPRPSPSLWFGAHTRYARVRSSGAWQAPTSSSLRLSKRGRSGRSSPVPSRCRLRIWTGHVESQTAMDTAMLPATTASRSRGAPRSRTWSVARTGGLRPPPGLYRTSTPSLSAPAAETKKSHLVSRVAPPQRRRGRDGPGLSLGGAVSGADDPARTSDTSGTNHAARRSRRSPRTNRAGAATRRPDWRDWRGCNGGSLGGASESSRRLASCRRRRQSENRISCTRVLECS